MITKYFSCLIGAALATLLYSSCQKDSYSAKNISRIESLVAKAQEAMTGVEEGPEPGFYPVGSVDQLKAAIDSAQRLTTKSQTQFGVDLAEIYLKKAIDQFSGSIQQEKQLYFDGSGYLNGGSAVPFIKPNFTLQAWVYPTEWKASMYIISTEGDKNGYKLNCPNGKPTIQIGNGTTTTNLATTDVINLNEWTHIASTYDGITLKIYINGNLAASKAVASTIASNTEKFRIGEGSKFTARTFKGRMKGVGVWSKALSDLEVKNLMTTKITGSETGLIAYWPFNLSSGSKIIDRTGSQSVDLINMTYVDPI